MKSIVLLALVAGIPFLSAFADQIVMRNGDRLSGKIVRSDEKILVLKTDYAGEIKLKWPEVDTITSTQPLHLQFKDGGTAAGNVTTRGADVVVSKSESESETRPRNTITAIRNSEKEAAYQRSLHPGLLEQWEGSINFGFNLTRGNSSTRNLNLAFKAARKTRKDKISLYASSIYATNDEPGATPATTANAEQGGARYDRDFDGRMFAFGSGDFQSDELQDLELRSVLGGGLGVHLLKSPAIALDLLGGMNYTRENYSAYTNSFPAGTFGQELRFKFLSHSEITQRMHFYPDFSNTGEYRFAFQIAEVSKLNSWLGWQTSFSNIYVTNPPAGKQRNDAVLTTGLHVNFDH
jgi:putative salt-induced outer membrane protein YdiY